FRLKFRRFLFLPFSRWVLGALLQPWLSWRLCSLQCRPCGRPSCYKKFSTGRSASGRDGDDLDNSEQRRSTEKSFCPHQFWQGTQDRSNASMRRYRFSLSLQSTMNQACFLVALALGGMVARPSPGGAPVKTVAAPSAIEMKAINLVAQLAKEDYAKAGRD